MLEQLEHYASLHDVPIMQKEGIEWFKTFIKEHNINSVIEIGTAIGYSAMQMKEANAKLYIDTIERDETMYAQASHNLKDLQDIQVHHSDALEFDLRLLQCRHYDLLFIDGAKSQYQRFLERYEHLIHVGGYIVVDNIDFHGMTQNPDQIKNRNTRQLVKKINRFKTWLEDNKHYDVHYLPLGDGILVAKKVKE